MQAKTIDKSEFFAWDPKRRGWGKNLLICL